MSVEALARGGEAHPEHRAARAEEDLLGAAGRIGDDDLVVVAAVLVDDAPAGLGAGESLVVFLGEGICRAFGAEGLAVALDRGLGPALARQALRLPDRVAVEGRAAHRGLRLGALLGRGASGQARVSRSPNCRITLEVTACDRHLARHVQDRASTADAGKRIAEVA